MKRSARFFFLALIPAFFGLYGEALAETYLLNGGQTAEINYMMVQEVEPHPGIKTLTLKFAVPRGFDSATYSQAVREEGFYFYPQPASQRRVTDQRGNEFVEAVFNEPQSTIRSTVRFVAENTVKLDTLETKAPFPVAEVPEEVRPFLTPTRLVQSEDPVVAAKALELTRQAKTEYDAVSSILTWLVDYMRYESRPQSRDALSALSSGRGNCQNYAHLAAGLMRSVGIPVRIVTGVTLKWPYRVKAKNAIITMNMAMGRHAWIEVYFPDLGWVPFNPQNSVLFVSNRFIRMESGRDNDEAAKDGFIQWTQPKGTTGQPRPSEIFHVDFLEDRVDMRADKAGYGPRALYLTPNVEGTFAKVKAAAAAGPVFACPVALPPASALSTPVAFGNMDFPEGLDFATWQGEPVIAEDGSLSYPRTFLAETAEYVTTKGEQYAQAFVTDQPLKLSEAGLALHSFGGEGQIWLELYRDAKNAPGELIGTSEVAEVERIPYKPGYNWENFNFAGDVVLGPGQYWLALGFTGSPIVNWFYTYGTPVGPQDGTRMKSMFAPDWKTVLANEFNYRIKGLTTE
ncbi:MAG: transglutaminase domain-containing protein [Deltaproteobacteria bacterium]|nr:transglutaminase domain-containing protein [Deltaproteobacteria bacterium]